MEIEHKGVISVSEGLIDEIKAYLDSKNYSYEDNDDDGLYVYEKRVK